MTFLRFDSLVKRYGALLAVDRFTLEVKKGDFVSLVGPSGCGKTTTLRMIAGFIRPDEGRIELDGDRIDTKPTHQRGTAMVFQNYALFPHMTVFDNVAFGLRMRKVERDEIRRRVTDALSLMRLVELAERYPRELSGGQQQRVALARAIVLNPKVLLLDEPLSNLDAKLRKELRKEILDLHRLANITTIFVTHDLEEAFSLSDVVAVMNAGRIEQVGAPIDIYHHPKTTFVANFIGYSNIFERNRPFGDAADADRIGEGEATPSSGRFAVPAQSVHVSTTPLHTDTALKGTISQIMFLGARMQITVDAGGQTIQAELPVNPTVHALGKGAEVFLGWNADEIVSLPEEQ